VLLAEGRELVHGTVFQGGRDIVPELHDPEGENTLRELVPAAVLGTDHYYFKPYILKTENEHAAVWIPPNKTTHFALSNDEQHHREKLHFSARKLHFSHELISSVCGLATFHDVGFH
jgi:hypothetical protein